MLARYFIQAKSSCAAALSDLADFLRRPKLGDVPELAIREKLTSAAWLFTFSMAITALSGILALPIVLTTDMMAGEQIGKALNASAASIVISVILLGPLVEEIIFRGWLSGSWRAITASALSLAVIYGSPAILDYFSIGEPRLRQTIIVTATIVTLFLWSPIDRARRIAGFEKAFPVIFWIQAIAFGALHFQNYASSSLTVSLGMSLPLVGCGLLWGHARIKLGLGWAIMLHAAYNVPAALGAIILLQFAA